MIDASMRSEGVVWSVVGGGKIPAKTSRRIQFEKNFPPRRLARGTHYQKLSIINHVMKNLNIRTTSKSYGDAYLGSSVA